MRRAKGRPPKPCRGGSGGHEQVRVLKDRGLARIARNLIPSVAGKKDPVQVRPQAAQEMPDGFGLIQGHPERVTPRSPVRALMSCAKVWMSISWPLRGSQSASLTQPGQRNEQPAAQTTNLSPGPLAWTFPGARPHGASMCP